MSEPDDAAAAAVELTELTGTEGGVWHVVTRDSVHLFDLDAMTVVRNPGPEANPGLSYMARPLRSILACKVGERGFWTIHAEGFSDVIEYFWHSSSVVQRIEREPREP